MNIQSIETEEDYRATLARLEIIFDAQPGTPEGDELEALGKLLDAYEAANHLIDDPGPD